MRGRRRVGFGRRLGQEPGGRWGVALVDRLHGRPWLLCMCICVARVFASRVDAAVHEEANGQVNFVRGWKAGVSRLEGIPTNHRSVWPSGKEGCTSVAASQIAYASSWYRIYPTQPHNMFGIRCLRSAFAPAASSLRPALPQLARQTLAPIQAARYASRDCLQHSTSHTNCVTSRPLSILSQLPSRPTVAPSTATHAITADIPTASFQLPSQPGLSLLQVRGAKRDTYDPSHRVRKRRHGFLSRLRSKNGRNTLKRRKLRGRNTLSH